MTWVTWRQYRYQSVLAAALLTVLAVALLPTGLHAAQVWHSAPAGCTRHGSCGPLSLSSSALTNLVLATAAVPLLPGLFWGVPAVAQELESGTSQFAWTQSITRRRWLAVRSGWLLLAAVALTGAVSALVTWWTGPDSALNADGFGATRFDITDIVPAGYAVFAMALGICAGALLRRTLPALAVTLGGFAALRVLTTWLRPHYLTPVTACYNLKAAFTPTGSYLAISQDFSGPNGQPVLAGSGSNSYFNSMVVPPVCQNANENGSPLSCLAAHGYQGYLTYQPASRFWAFQGIETGIFVALAAVLLAVTFWVLERRDA